MCSPRRGAPEGVGGGSLPKRGERGLLAYRADDRIIDGAEVAPGPYVLVGGYVGYVVDRSDGHAMA